MFVMSLMVLILWASYYGEEVEEAYWTAEVVEILAIHPATVGRFIREGKIRGERLRIC